MDEELNFEICEILPFFYYKIYLLLLYTSRFWLAAEGVISSDSTMASEWVRSK